MPFFLLIKVKLLALWAWLKIKFALTWVLFKKLIATVFKKLTWWDIFKGIGWIVSFIVSLIPVIIDRPYPPPLPAPESKPPITQNPNVGLGEIPYHVSIQFQSENNPVQHHCSGALIDEKHVLTLGSCFINCNEVLNSVAYISKWKVVVGSTEVPYGTSFKVNKIARHPEYKPNRKSNNIAIMRLMQSVDVEHVNIISLPERGEILKTGDELFVSGFGETPIRRGSLKKFTVRVESFRNCQHHFPFQDLDGKFCAIVMLGHRQRMGDNGGPATVNKKFVVGIWLQHSNKGAAYEIPEIYTNVTYYLNFIKTVTT